MELHVEPAERRPVFWPCVTSSQRLAFRRYRGPRGWHSGGIGAGQRIFRSPLPGDADANDFRTDQTLRTTGLNDHILNAKQGVKEYKGSQGSSRVTCSQICMPIAAWANLDCMCSLLTTSPNGGLLGRSRVFDMAFYSKEQGNLSSGSDFSH